MFPRTGGRWWSHWKNQQHVHLPDLLYVPRFGTKRGMLGLKGSVNYSDRGRHRTCWFHTGWRWGWDRIRQTCRRPRRCCHDSAAHQPKLHRPPRIVRPRTLNHDRGLLPPLGGWLQRPSGQNTWREHSWTRSQAQMAMDNNACCKINTVQMKCAHGQEAWAASPSFKSGSLDILIPEVSVCLCRQYKARIHHPLRHVGCRMLQI